MVEPCDLRLLVPPGPGTALSSQLASESEVETWDLRASFTEYLWAVLRDLRDFQEPLPTRDLFPESCSSVPVFCPDLRGMAFTSQLRKTSSRDGRVKSVNTEKHQFYSPTKMQI